MSADAVLKPCKDYVPLVLNFLVVIRHPGLRADSQWIIDDDDDDDTFMKVSKL